MKFKDNINWNWKDYNLGHYMTAKKELKCVCVFDDKEFPEVHNLEEVSQWLSNNYNLTFIIGNDDYYEEDGIYKPWFSFHVRYKDAPDGSYIVQSIYNKTYNNALKHAVRRAILELYKTRFSTYKRLG